MESRYSIFQELEHGLMTLDKPSLYLRELLKMPATEDYPFIMLRRLQNTKQSPRYHPEGNVWNHTLLVVDEAAKVKVRSLHPDALMWAALLHDIGKPGTTKIRKQRITSYGHDKLGAVLAEDFLLKFNCCQELVRRVSYLVHYHMQLLFVLNGTRFADIDGMMREGDVREVALLGLCDRLGRKDSDKKSEESNIRAFLEKCGCLPLDIRHY